MYAKLSPDFWLSVSRPPKLSQVSSPGRNSLAPTTSSATERWEKMEESGHSSSCTWWVWRWPWGRELQDRQPCVVLGTAGKLTLAEGISWNKTVWGSSVPLMISRSEKTSTVLFTEQWSTHFFLNIHCLSRSQGPVPGLSISSKDTGSTHT